MDSTEYARYSGLGGTGGGGGVTSLNGLTGALLLAAGADISITSLGSTITISSTLTFGNLTDVGTDGITITGGTGAVHGAGTQISQQVATGSENGYLSAADWSTFNSKQPALTFGNLTESTSDVLTIVGGTGAVIGTGTSIDVKKASGTQDGYLSSVDWNTFNSKQAAGNYATSGSGDVSWAAPSGGGPVVTSIAATSNATLVTLSALVLPTTQLSGTLQAAQEPAHTGDVTNSAGSLVLSLVATSNSTLVTLSALSLPASQVTGLTVYANQHLSNLIGPTSINADLIPATDNTINLGSASKAFNNVNATAFNVYDAFNDEIGSFYQASGNILTVAALYPGSNIYPGGALAFSTANSTANNAGNIGFTGGNSTAGNGASLVFTPGTGSVNPGYIQFNTGTTPTVGWVWTAIDTSGDGNWAVAPSQIVSKMRYYGTSSTPGTIIAPSLITFSTQDYDNNSAYSSGTFVVPTGDGGIYEINSQISVGATFVANDQVNFYIYHNGSPLPVFSAQFAQVSVFSGLTCILNDALELADGDTIQIYAGTNGTSPTINTALSWLSITRVSN
jgi:hypothetical protein